MFKFLRWDSPFMQKIALVGNLVALNLLWILCCLPVVTAGAATVAMYHTVFQFQTNHETAVLKPFFRAFGKNFIQATLLWLLILAVDILLILDIRFLFAFGGGALMWIAIIAVSAFILLMQSQLLPQVARFQAGNMTVLKNAGILTVLHLPTSVLMTVLNILPVVIFFLLPRQFMQWLPLWVGIWFSLVAYLNGRMLLRLWSKHMPAEETQEDTPPA